MGSHKVPPREGDIVDSGQAADAADAASERPEVKRWCKRLRRLIKDMPDGIQVYVGESISVLASGPNGEYFMTDTGGRDTASVVDSSNDGRWDGGGW